jgi:Tol biopolymer transport system component
MQFVVITMTIPNCYMKAIIAILSLILCSSSLSFAQYFGKNKPNYQSVNFSVLETPSFDIYHYLENPTVLQTFAQDAETWFQLHQGLLNDTIKGKNPLVLYNNHADFQQTNAIMGSIGVGTGGVTEAFKNRVILPFAMSNQQTHHVLGHELVHAYQYNMILNGDSTSIRNLNNLPLWMVEGMAEYLSIGSIDANTAMWMRDAVLNDKFPTLRDLNKAQYFPYRYGQAFWVFLTGLFGDEVIRPFFIGTAKYGFDEACLRILGMREKDLSKLWVDTYKNYFQKQLSSTSDKLPGTEIISGAGPGRLNIAPVLSPNGKYVIFLSERDLFSIDLYLADAGTGKILRKIGGTLKDGHLDDISYIESAGSWSPKGDEFVFTGVRKGKNVLVFKNAENGKTIRTVAIPGVPAFTNPAWSPDGRKIVVAGLVHGQVDLYAYEIKGGKVNQLTNDSYAEIMPAWSADGSQLIFSTDELSMRNGRTHGKWKHNIAVMDAVGGRITHIDVFPQADNLNAQFDPNGDILFLSDRDGFRNLYRFDILTEKVYQLTNTHTGISGITPFAPAFSIDRKRNRIAYTHYHNGAYSIYKARAEDFNPVEVDPDDVNFGPATLPRVNRQASRIVDNTFEQLDRLSEQAFITTERPYRPKFALDYVGGSAGIGTGTSNLFGASTGGAGGVDLLFSDMTGNNKIFSTLAINGEIQDFGGVINYLNQKSRIGWGATLSHIPAFFLEGYEFGLDTLPVGGGQSILAIRESLIAQRLFESRAGLFTQYPFSRSLRVEASGNYTHYGFSRRRYDTFYDTFGRYIGQDRERLDAPEGFSLYNVGTALVGDNSSFGMTSPLAGHRFRVGLNQYFGPINFTSVTADFRRYFRVKPFTFAFRGMHDGRYGGNAQFFPLFVISPWYIRGYADFLGATNTQDIINRYGLTVEDYRASKVLVGNAEIRIPLSGPKKLGLITSNALMSELSFFADGGMAFNQLNQLFGNVEDILRPRLLASVGVSLRLNIFGALIAEPYYAIPVGLELPPGQTRKGSFGVNLIPGW